MITLSNEKRENYLRALFVGPTGRGKTIGACSFPGKTLILDVDNRHAPVIDWYADRLGDFDVEVVTVDNFFTDFKNLTLRLKMLNPYTNIILDGVTTLSTLIVVLQMINKGALENWSKASEKDLKQVGKVTKGGIAVPSWDEFNGEAMYMSMLLEGFKSLKCNFFLSAHPVKRTVIKEGDKAASYFSITTFGPKVESIIPTYFDEVWYFDYEFSQGVDGKPFLKRQVHTQPSLYYLEAKTALKGVPPVIDITNKSLYDQVKDFL